MAARKRHHNETFKKYRENLKDEHKKLKKILRRGWVLWNSKNGPAMRTTAGYTALDK